MSYKTHTERKAVKEIKALDKTTVKRIRDRINELAINPYDTRISGNVRMGEGERKSRVGDWRIIFEVDEASHTVKVTAVRPRRRAYPKQ
jgi:mRNA interferase RelE/StbE